MSIPPRWTLALALALAACSSSSVNDEQGSGGSGGDAGGAGGTGGSAGSASGGTAGQAGVSGTAGSDGGATCAGDALQCVTCCASNQPVGYDEFLDEFQISQCSGQACSGTCIDVCANPSPTVSQSCAECFYAAEPDIHTQVGLACKLSAHAACEAFASCLKTCQVE